MKVVYVFSSTGQTVDYILGDMILPQLEHDNHGVDVAGMFFSMITRTRSGMATRWGSDLRQLPTTRIYY